MDKVNRIYSINSGKTDFYIKNPDENANIDKIKEYIISMVSQRG